MNSRQRLLMSFNHRQPDRVSIDLGGTLTSTISEAALGRLKDYRPKVKPVILKEGAKFTYPDDKDTGYSRYPDWRERYNPRIGPANTAKRVGTNPDAVTQNNPKR